MGIGWAANPLQWLGFAATDTSSTSGTTGQILPGGTNGSANLQSWFAAVDTDGNGQISQSEATSAYNKLSSALQSQLLQAQEQSGVLPTASAHGRFFASADTDNSGSLSLAEFSAAVTKNLPPGATAPTADQLQARFDAIDTNGDGQISPDEMKAAHKHRHHHAMAQSQDTTADANGTTSSTDTTSATGTTPPTDLGSLLQQTMSAYGQMSPGDLVHTAASLAALAII